MPLESLLTLVEKLRERIDVHGPALRQNEMLTRYALIDPLLRELEWDTEDPTWVKPEYTGLGGVADYALFSGERLLVIVEAKKLDTSLREGKVLSQGLNYCQQQGTPYLAVTDGRRWDIYETHKLASIDEKRIAAFDLKSQPAAEACLQALTLWRRSVDSGPIAPGQTLIVGPTHNQPDSSEAPTPQPTPPSPDKQEWQSLSNWNPQSSRSPVEIQFPDNSVSPVRWWKSLLVEVVRWLEKTRLLTADHCPLRMGPNSRRYVLSTRPVHLDEKPFLSPKRAGLFHIETNESSKGIVRATRTIIEHVGQDPAQFKVRSS